MSDPVSALGGKTYDGFAQIREVGPLGMVSLRCDLAEKALPALVKSIVGSKIPTPRMIEIKGEKAVGWMSPDELLILMPYQDVAKAIDNIGKKLSEVHHLVVDVSDARACLRYQVPRPPRC